mgnify:CR=1 FL=1
MSSAYFLQCQWLFRFAVLHTHAKIILSRINRDVVPLSMQISKWPFLLFSLCQSWADFFFLFERKKTPCLHNKIVYIIYCSVWQSINKSGGPLWMLSLLKKIQLINITKWRNLALKRFHNFIFKKPFAFCQEIKCEFFIYRESHFLISLFFSFTKSWKVLTFLSTRFTKHVFHPGFEF